MFEGSEEFYACCGVAPSLPPQMLPPETADQD
jgi:hypothetical protein